MKNSSTRVQLINVSQAAQLTLGNCFGLLLFTGPFFNRHEPHVHKSFPKHLQFPVFFAFLYSERCDIISES